MRINKIRSLLINLGILLGAFCLTLSAQIIISPTPFTPGGSGTITGGTCTNQAVTAIDTSGVPTCTTLSSAYVNSSIAPTASPTFTTLVNLESTGVRFTAADGVLTLLGLGNGNDENLTIDLDNAAANVIALSSSTSADLITWPDRLGISSLLGIGNNYRIDGSYEQLASFRSNLAPAAATYLGGLVQEIVITPGGNIDGFEAYDVVLNQLGTADNLYLNGSFFGTYAGGSGTISEQYGMIIWTTQMSTGNTTDNYALFIEVGPHDVATGDVTGNNYGVYVRNGTAAGITGSVNNHFSFYSRDLVSTSTNGYFAWYDGGAGANCDSGGVWRVNDFGILAYYNPCFTKYTPGAANFERLIIRAGDTGVFGTDNTGYIGWEEGGTGVMRPLVLMGSSISFQDDAGASVYFEASEQTAPGAPAADAVRIYTQDNGAGKTQVCALFSSGAAQCFATQP